MFYVTRLLLHLYATSCVDNGQACGLKGDIALSSIWS